MSAILAACQAQDYPLVPKLVLSNRPDAGGLETAANAGISTAAIDHRPYGKDRESFEQAMQKVLVEYDVEMIALAGFMRILTPWFVDQWSGRMVNIHPSLLPKYPGLNTHARAIEAQDAQAGCSVHWVTSGVDEGAVIEQAATPIHASDTPDSLAERILVLEHDLYPRALAIAAQSVLTAKDQ